VPPKKAPCFVICNNRIAKDTNQYKHKILPDKEKYVILHRKKSKKTIEYIIL
jgi:hypothetical protein